MPKLLYSSEKWGCGVTIQLDNKDVIIVSIDQGELLVRNKDHREGFLKTITSNLNGPAIYRSKNQYKTAKIAEHLDIAFREDIPGVVLHNPVLSSFAKAICQCSSADEVELLLHKFEPSVEEVKALAWSVTNDDTLSFYKLALSHDWKKTLRGCNLYNVILSDDRIVRKFLTRDELATWPSGANKQFEVDHKPLRIVRLENLDGVTVWEWRKSG